MPKRTPTMPSATPFSRPTQRAARGRPPADIDLINLIGKLERDLIVIGLQALHRERITAWNTASTVASQKRRKLPERSVFGIDEVTELLHRIGAAPL